MGPTTLAGMMVSLLLTASAQALDQPIDAVKLVLKRSATAETLVFVSRDADALFPSLGGADDPAVGSPGGALVDLFSASEGSASLAVPPGAGSVGWTVSFGPPPRLRFRNPDAPAGISAVRVLLLKQGRVLKVVAKAVGLPLATPQGAVGIRVVTGTLRNCARFAGEAVRKDVAGKFVGQGALAAGLADCSDGSLAGGTTTSTSTTSTTTLLPCQFQDVGEPICAGACPAGSQCVAELNPQVAIGCVCLPDGLSPCAGSGYPTCGGDCSVGRVCQGALVIPGEGGGGPFELCVCVDPGNACDHPAGTCFAIGVCPAGQVCGGVGPPTSGCACGAP
jgi:hypothetical protein